MIDHKHIEGTAVVIDGPMTPIKSVVVCRICGVKMPYVEPPVFQYDREVGIAKIKPLDPLELVDICKERCEFASVCSAPRTTMGCGGCCECMAACHFQWEMTQIAPILWEGDFG